MRRSRGRWRPTALTAVLLGLIGVLAAACGGDDYATLRGAVRAPALDVGAISLPDTAHPGVPVALQAPPDELYAVYFGYTHCPDVCPTTLSDLAVAIGDLPDALADRVTVVMVTVDPERDTDEVLGAYLGSFFDDGMALRTTDAAMLRTAADAFGVQWEIEAHEPGDMTYSVGHTAMTYIVDDTGTVRVEWPFGFDTASMTADLRLLLRKDSA